MQPCSLTSEGFFFKFGSLQIGQCLSLHREVKMMRSCNLEKISEAEVRGSGKEPSVRKPVTIESSYAGSAPALQGEGWDSVMLKFLGRLASGIGIGIQWNSHGVRSWEKWVLVPGWPVSSSKPLPNSFTFCPPCPHRAVVLGGSLTGRYISLPLCQAPSYFPGTASFRPAS